jgi:hypothetical protein
MNGLVAKTRQVVNGQSARNWPLGQRASASAHAATDLLEQRVTPCDKDEAAARVAKKHVIEISV